ncbi:MAG TPA: enterobactin synthase subunit EntD, partial [Enterobacteriaceae bacterium]|nr:enterobactin synthase subunit EntD [Enterobacteriaceae bacterium]
LYHHGGVITLVDVECAPQTKTHVIT